MNGDRNLARIARALRDEIIEHHWASNEPIADELGLKNLDESSSLAPRRAQKIVDLYQVRTGCETISGLAVVELACGFGAISLYLASGGATVVGIDPDEQRIRVARRIADRFGLDASFAAVRPDEPSVPARFHLAVIDRDLDGVDDPTIAHAQRLLRPGGWLLLRTRCGPPGLGSWGSLGPRRSVRRAGFRDVRCTRPTSDRNPCYLTARRPDERR